MSSEGRRADKIETQIAALKSLNVSETIARIRDLVVNLYSNEVCWQVEIETALLNSFSIDINNSECKCLLKFSDTKSFFLADFFYINKEKD